MKKILIAGNWKMNKDINESLELISALSDGIKELDTLPGLLVCPPFTSLAAVVGVCKDTAISVGAQNCHTEKNGAYTGEISTDFIANMGCDYVIIGHSERRTLFGEGDELANAKTTVAIATGLNAIFCIGETLEEREAGKTFEVLERQIKLGLKNIEFSDKIVIAYEPVWAIGTGVAAVPDQVQEAHAFIRKQLTELYGDNSKDVIILYGGSMNDKNAKELLSLQDVNGGLIGGASLKPEAFLSIIKSGAGLVN
jgi:triosephosphate isomerase (TIM)